MTAKQIAGWKRAAAGALAPLEQWRGDCHSASRHLINCGIGTRVARGVCSGVPCQHSWVVCGMDCYDYKAIIIDPTLWCYRKDVKGVFVGRMQEYGHRPHGAGQIWSWGKPAHQGGKTVELKPKTPLSASAKMFLDMIGSLDIAGWQTLAATAPVGGWPAAEILAAIEDTFPGLVPIDRIGMLTDRNPKGLYLPTKTH